MYADDIGISLSTVLNYRFTSHRWPAAQRREGVSHKVHSILASVRDGAERSAAAVPTGPERSRRRWSASGRRHRPGRRPRSPFPAAPWNRH
ncbi:DUF6192 family protein [Streptomyces sp. Ag109_O5-1]|uniref:DUF6192 family protein n=1 Tax=Streptomyces sp. Ag109_O5-1 TaxID=1938851 RepID=UPI0037DA0EDA